MARNILIADDDADLAKIIARRCMHLGHRVSTAPDGLSAIVLVKHDPPDLLLLDIDLPVGNGLGVLELLRSTPHWDQIPVIIISGREEASLAEALARTATPFVAKTDGFWQRLEPLIASALAPAPPKPHCLDRALQPAG